MSLVQQGPLWTVHFALMSGICEKIVGIITFYDQGTTHLHLYVVNVQRLDY